MILILGADISLRLFFPFVMGGGNSPPQWLNVVKQLSYHLVMTNIAMEAMAHRNRWFTY
jgi:hypothetical protein